MKFLQKKVLLGTVFITGAAILIIEIAAFRILAPYFGNTLYSTSSIIGVVLGALSIGYYTGGILADRYPSRSLFFLLILLAGIFSLLIQVLADTVLRLLGYSLDMIIGPAVMSTVLFFVPSAILGMMSPFAIKLLSIDSREMGRISGSVFFWSTLGSIFGSFAAGFVLIPRLGISTIVISVGLALIAIGGLGSISFLRKHSIIFLVLTFFIPGGIGLSIDVRNAVSPDNIIYEDDGFYSLIRVQDTKIGDRAARILTLDRDTHGVLLRDDFDSFFTYLDYFPIYKLVNPEAKNFLFIGGGAYVAPRDILLDHANSAIRVEVAEIEPGLLDLARRYFDLPEDSRLTNTVMDGRRFLANREDGTYDVIFGDAYSSSLSIPSHLVTTEFFNLVRNKLGPHGVFVGNFIGNPSRGKNLLLASEIKTFRSVFPNSYFFAVTSLKKEGPQNFIFLGIKNDIYQLDLNSEDARMRMPILAEKIIDTSIFSFEMAYVFSDDFVPIEYLVARSEFQ